MITTEEIKELGFKQYGNTKVGNYWNTTSFVKTNYESGITYYLTHHSHKQHSDRSKINLNEARGIAHTQTLYHGYLPSKNDFERLINWLNIKL